MNLENLLQYQNITIQCHDNPDADALASGYALYCYFMDMGKKVELVYGGPSKVQKSNLKLMIDKLEIDARYIKESELPKEIEGLLITVDCQYGAGNVTGLEAKNIAIIDHHQAEVELLENVYILPDRGSCSSIVWELLCNSQYDVNQNVKVATALYYGLMSDTNNFSEIHNPVDRDMKETLRINQSDISLFCNSNISLKELEIAGIAMLRYSFNEDYNFAVIKAQPCDGNILGLISDFLLQVDKVNTCLVYNELDAGYKLSVRSCVREVNAKELAEFLTKDIGSGGGHYQKAGGFISKKLYEKKCENIHTEAFFNNRMIEYFDNFDLIYAEEYEADLSTMQKYRKKKLPVGYVLGTDLLPTNTPITIRTMEGDIDIVIDENLVIMIGSQGEVYPNDLEKFNRTYNKIEGKYVYSIGEFKDKYQPMVINRTDGKRVALADFVNKCISSGEVQIYVKELESDVKLFTNWDLEKYMVGKAGDYIAVRTDDVNDVYIIDRHIFAKTYEKIDE